MCNPDSRAVKLEALVGRDNVTLYLKGGAPVKVTVRKEGESLVAHDDKGRVHSLSPESHDVHGHTILFVRA